MPRTLTNVILLLTLLWVFSQNVTRHAVIFKLTNTVCESYNKSWVTIDYCRLKAVQRNKTILNIIVNVLHPANDIKVKLQIQKKANGYKPWLFDITVDGCQYMRKNNNAAAKVLLDLFQDFSTVNHTCPYVGVQMLKDFYPRPEKLMLPLPTGDYLLLLTFIFNKQPTLSVNAYFTFVEDFKIGRS